MEDKENFLEYTPGKPEEIPATLEEKGITVDIEDYYRLISEIGYGKLSREDTAAFLSKLKEAGKDAEILRYFVATIKHPYLCRSAADKEAFTPEEYARYYYSAVAVRELNSITHYFGHAIQAAHEGILLALLRAEEYEAGVAFAANAKEIRATLGEEAYRGVVPSLDAVAKNIGEGRYLQYKKGSGTYEVDALTFLTDLKHLVDSGNTTTRAIKTALAAGEDTLKVLNIEAFIMPDVKKLMQEVREKVAQNRSVLTKILTNLLKQQKKKEVREAYTRHLEANYIREALSAIISLEDAKPNKAEYMQNLTLYAGDTYYIARLVDEYKKANNEEGIL